MDLSKQKILVTGGAGFLGKQVVAQLLAAGADKEKISIPRSKDLDLCKWENCQKAVASRVVL
jgi:GDP-L-fucose synthase